MKRAEAKRNLFTDRIKKPEIQVTENTVNDAVRRAIATTVDPDREIDYLLILTLGARVAK